LSSAAEKSTLDCSMHLPEQRMFAADMRLAF